MRQQIVSIVSRPTAPQSVAPRPLARGSTFGVVVIVACCLVIGAVARHARATATVERDVLLSSDGGMTFYANDPTTEEDEGIPMAGNFLAPNPPPQGQITFEGRVDTMNTATTLDDTNVNFDIYVGRTSSGILTIDGGTELRDMNLIIGGAGENANGQITRGTGFVFIQNPGSLYNNNPNILPYPFSETGMSPSVNPRIDEPGAMLGFDLFVGRAGTGQMVISLGGAAEIEDAVIVGDRSGSTGSLTVDGFASFLGSGGFEVASGGNIFERHEMIIGRLGDGRMDITNGGTVYALAPDDMVQMESAVAAVIGSNRPAMPAVLPELGGNGIVNVDGFGSKWVVGGTLQIGGFHDSINLVDGMEDMEGDEAFYSSGVGTGTLNILNGGLVSIISPIPAADDDGSDPNQPTKLDLWIGELGKLYLDGGSLNISPATISVGGAVSTREINNYRLINDGEVGGTGSILVGQFRNRALGIVSVDAGESLVISASGRFDITETLDELPLQNFGLIEVLGAPESRAELTFERVAGTTPEFPAEPGTPFVNQRQGTVPLNGGRSQGDIFVQHGKLRFRSGLENHGNLIFTAGDNVVSGDVFNDVDGQIFIAGNNTTVTFEDSIINSGTFEIGPNASIVTSLVDVTLGGAGSLSMTLGGSGNGQQVSYLSVVGDLMLDGLLEISLFPGAGNPFSPQPGDTFEIMHALGEMTGDFAAISLPFVSPTIGLFAFPDYTLDSYFVTTFAAMPGSGSADLNGDGVVDGTDLAIWEQNLGNPGGLGDINGDGIVDGLDYFIWLAQASGFPGAASGGGAGGALGGAVPEPSSLALLAVGGLLALAWRRCGGISLAGVGRIGRVI